MLALSLGEKIQHAREAQHLTIRHLAALAEIDRATLRNIELDKADPKISTLKKILTALGFEKESDLDFH